MEVVVCYSFALPWGTPLLFVVFFLLLCQTQTVCSSQRYSFMTKSLCKSETLYLHFRLQQIYIYIYKQKDRDFNFTWTRKSVVYDKGILFILFFFGGGGGKETGCSLSEPYTFMDFLFFFLMLCSFSTINKK